MLRHYEIPQPPVTEEPQSGDPLWNFMRVGYGECFDSFFAFGLYRLARDSGLFPPALLDDHRADRAGGGAPHPLLRQLDRLLPRPPAGAGNDCCTAGAARWRCRCRCGRGSRPPSRAARGGGDDAGGDEDDFMLGVKDSLDVVSSPRQFLEVCLRENDRRLAPYDPRLLRPTFVPTLARALARVVP